MLQSSIPAKFPIPWGNNAGAPYTHSIPVNSQIGTTNGAASLTDGFPPLTFTPESAGGTPPFGKDFNGILNQITQWSQWFSAGGAILYDATFQAAIGGYPNGAIVGSLIVPGNFWMSTVDSNTSNPDSGGANWVTPPAMRGTGEMQTRLLADTVAGWVILNGTTIGNAASGASQRANADTLFLYSYFWNGFSNTQCPVTGGRGATAAADFAAGKPIATYNMQATGVIGVDGMGGTATGLLSGVPVQSGAVTTPGSIIGQNLHALIATEIPSISFSGSGSGTTANTITVYPGGNSAVNFAFTNGTVGSNEAAPQSGPSYPTTTGTWAGVNNAAASNNISVSVSVSGSSTNTSGASHNTVERSATVYWYMKL